MSTQRFNVDGKVATGPSATKKKFSRWAIFCSLFFAVAFGALPRSADAAPIGFANSVLANSPLGYWRLNESPGAATAIDASLNTHDGAYSTTGIALGTPGLGGGDTAALFDGLGSGRVIVPDSASLNPNSITIEAIVRWDGPNGLQQRIVEKSREANGHTAIYGMSINDNGTVQFEISTGSFASGTPHFLVSNALIQASATSHLVATYDGSQLALYINGVLDSSLAATTNLVTDSFQPLGLGNQATRDRPFHGILDEVALYDHPLSSSSVLVHFETVPEPATLTLGGLGLLGFLGFLRKKNRRPDRGHAGIQGK